MRIGGFSFAACSVIALSSAIAQFTPAQAAPTYPWCVLQSGPCSSDCSYTTIDQCRAAASGVGTCFQNPAFTAASPARSTRLRR